MRVAIYPNPPSRDVYFVTEVLEETSLHEMKVTTPAGETRWYPPDHCEVAP